MVNNENTLSDLSVKFHGNVHLGTCSVVFMLLLGLLLSALQSRGLCCKNLLNKMSTIFLFHETNQQDSPSHKPPDTQEVRNDAPGLFPFLKL